MKHVLRCALLRQAGSAVILALASLIAPVHAFTPVTSSQLVFVNVDHAPIGVASTFLYGGKGDQCGLGMTSCDAPYSGGGGGVVIGLKSSAGLQIMPFVAATGNVSSTASFFPDANVTRAIGPSTDQWNVQSGALSWTHYSPAWNMPSLSSATLPAKERFFLPATWMVFTVNNTSGQAEDFYFGLPAKAAETTFAEGAYQGVTYQEASFATPTGAGDVLTGSSLTAALDGMSTGFAFHMTVPAHQSKTLPIVIAYYRTAGIDGRISGEDYYKTLFSSIDQIVDFAMATLPDAQTRCQELATAMQNSNLNVYRQFLASHALHSYQACTLCLSDPSGNAYWREMEGGYNYINTFDLTVDHCFYDSLMYPWALRNVLDTMSGANNGGVGYTYDHPLYQRSTGMQVSSTGFSFHHDMGLGYTQSDDPTQDPTAYENQFSYMGQEQLENWILCAGIYWSRTSDNTWLSSNQTLLQTCLNSMLLRDDTVAANRDGVTSYVNERAAGKYEITTFDALDASLQRPDPSGRSTVRNWAAYLALQAMFTQNGDTADATTCGNMAGVCASTIVSKWNTYSPTLGYLPAFLDGSNTAATIPTIEGLAFPQQMGLASAVNLSTGPYATMLQDLKSHMTNILVSGICLDATSGGWKLTTGSTNTWQSKVYLAQYEAEKILGLTGNTVDGTVDQIHATFQMQEAPVQGWSDQVHSTGDGTVTSSVHYPRGITSALWWLSPTNNPVFPNPSAAPGAPTGLAAQSNLGQVILSWTSAGQTATFNVARATASAGPYTTIATGLTGASYVDFTETASGSYYYTVSGTNSVGTGAVSTPLTVNVLAGHPPSGWVSQDVGSVGLAGSDSYSPGDNTFGLLASGTDIYGSADSFHYLAEPATGNCSIIARVASIGASSRWAKAGVMIRNSSSPGDLEAAVVVTSGEGVSFQWRSSVNGATTYVPDPAVSGLVAPYWVQLTRNGSTFTAAQSPDGMTWTTIGTATITMTANVSIGLAATSHYNSVLNPAVIDNVRLSVLPPSWTAQDIGSPGLAGATTYSPMDTFNLQGSGGDIYGNSDSFQFASLPVTGDCAIIAHVASQGNSNSWAKTGLMIRNSLASNDMEASTLVTPGNGVSFQSRTASGGNTTYTPNPTVKGNTAPYWVELVRSGSTFTGLQSADGVVWTTTGTATIPMGATVYVGLADCSHDNTILNPAIIDNVELTALPSPWLAQDVGTPGIAGNTSYSPDNTFLLTGSGADINGTSDSFQFAYQTVNGDCSIIARVASQTGVNSSAKAGVMIRNSLSPSDLEASVLVTPGTGVLFQNRPGSGANTGYSPDPTVSGPVAPYWVKLVRAGNTFTASQSIDGTTWSTIGSITFTMGTAVDIGFAVTSHDNTTSSTATFDNITVSP